MFNMLWPREYIIPNIKEKWSNVFFFSKNFLHFLVYYLYMIDVKYYHVATKLLIFIW